MEQRGGGEVLGNVQGVREQGCLVDSEEGADQLCRSGVGRSNGGQVGEQDG